MISTNNETETNRYQALFLKLKQQRQGAFIPFFTLGDPCFDVSLDLINCAIKAGADGLELGFPFSDPLADGPVIQGANIRALSSGMTPSRCFEMIAQIRSVHPDIPIGLLLYANLVFSNGIDHFYERCQDAGVDSVLIADVPLCEASPFIRSATQCSIAPIFIAPPNGDDATLMQVAQLSKGYVYLLSRAGITGVSADKQAQMPGHQIIKCLKQYNAPPTIQGFGIATPAHVKQALDNGADGIISGSAVVKIIEQYQHDPNLLIQKMATFVTEMKAATRLSS